MDSELVRALSRRTGEMMRSIRPVACAGPLPSRDGIGEILDRLRSILFPGYFGDPEVTEEGLDRHLGDNLDLVRRALGEQVKRGICFTCEDVSRAGDCGNQAERITETLLARLPVIQGLLALDVAAAYEGDPAATSPAEAIFCYPGVHAITNFRIAHELQLLGVPILPRMITEMAHGLTGIDIHPGATIGESFFIDHGTGVVIGETSEIGDRVRIYQGVTLGAKSFPLDENGKPMKGVPRHPIIEDDVVIYAGATILGRVTVGRGAVVGGNVWLTRSVSPGTVVTQQTPHLETFARGGGI